VKIRSIMLWFLMLSMISACSTAAVPESTVVNETESTDVRLALPFRPDIQFSPVYVGLEQGFWHDEGANVTIEHLQETDAVALVGSGEIPFAIVSGEQVLLARAQGLPVVYVMAWFQDYPVAVAAPAASGINVPADLEGRKVGIPILAGASYIGYRAMLSAQGLPADIAELDSIGYNQVETLLEGHEDAVVIYANNEPLQLEARGMDVQVIRVAEYVHLISNGLITNEAMIRDNPELVRSMVKAMVLSVDHALQNPEYAFNVSKDYVVGLESADQHVQTQILAATMDYWRAEQIGYSQPEAWVNMQDILLEMGLLSETLQIEAAYSNAFLP